MTALLDKDKWASDLLDDAVQDSVLDRLFVENPFIGTTTVMNNADSTSAVALQNLINVFNRNVPKVPGSKKLEISKDIPLTPSPLKESW